MYKTINNTTTTVGQSTATVLAYSENPGTKTRLITWELTYPRYIHSEVMTHRSFSRNASSSRATPVKTLIEEVRTNPVYFDEIRLNQRGMAGGDLVSPEVEGRFHDLWDLSASFAASIAKQMNDLGVAKQTVNRILEPYLPIRTIVTATDVENFFKLRLAPDAQPEIQSLAKAMMAAMSKAEPKATWLHLPYGGSFSEPSDARQINRCVAACARVSILRGDGKQTSYEDDLALVSKLKAGKHMTPFEHIAFADLGRFANFTDWCSARWEIERGEAEAQK